jgi:hypothetical protein
MQISRNTYYFLGFCLLCVLFSACGKDEQSLFQIQMEAEFNLPAGLNTIETHYFYPTQPGTNNVEIPTNFEIFRSNASINEERIGAVLANRSSFIALFGENLEFINTISMWVYPVDSNVGTEIFYQDLIEFGNRNELQLFPGIANVKDILSQDEVIIELRINTRSFSSQNIDIRVDLDFSVFEVE